MSDMTYMTMTWHDIDIDIYMTIWLYDIWHMTYDIWHMTYDIWTWHMTYDIWHMTTWWHMTYDIWHMTYDTWHLTYDIWHDIWHIWHMTESLSHDSKTHCHIEQQWQLPVSLRFRISGAEQALWYDTEWHCRYSSWWTGRGHVCCGVPMPAL